MGSKRRKSWGPGLQIVDATPWHIECSDGWLGRQQASMSADGLYVAEESL